MYELLYTSVSPKGLSESELASILELARIKNEKLGITGMLVYHDREIMQILEGEEGRVRELFDVISRDERHTSVKIFYQGNIEQRAFTGWSMAFKLLDDKSIAEITKGYEDYSLGMSPISMIKDNPNHGRKAFTTILKSL